MNIKFAVVFLFVLSLSVLAISVLAISVLAQPGKKEVIDDISTDRPDQSESPLLVPEGFFQAELGGSTERVTGFGTTIYALSAPAVLLRYGLWSNVELRLGAEYLITRYRYSGNFASDNFEIKGPVPLMIGTKIKLAEEKGVKPDMAFIFSLSLPVFDNRYKTSYIGSEFRLAMAHTLGDRFSLSCNLGGAWDGDEPNVIGLYTLALGASIVNRLGVFAEVYGFLPQKSEPDHRFDAGFTFLIAKNIQADVSGGFGISKSAPDYFIGAGISFRLPK